MKKSRLKSRFTAFTMATVLCMVSVPVTTVNVNAKSKKSESEKIIKVCQEYWRERHPYNPLDR